METFRKLEETDIHPKGKKGFLIESLPKLFFFKELVMVMKLDTVYLLL